MLFGEKEITEEDKQLLIRKLSQSGIQNESAQKLEANIENEEVLKVMDALPLGKQAGPNRIPNGLYRCMSTFFAPLLAPILRDIVSGKGKLPAHMLEGDITILYKK